MPILVLSCFPWRVVTWRECYTRINSNKGYLWSPYSVRMETGSHPRNLKWWEAMESQRTWNWACAAIIGPSNSWSRENFYPILHGYITKEKRWVLTMWVLHTVSYWWHLNWVVILNVTSHFLLYCLLFWFSACVFLPPCSCIVCRATSSLNVDCFKLEKLVCY